MTEAAGFNDVLLYEIGRNAAGWAAMYLGLSQFFPMGSLSNLRPRAKRADYVSRVVSFIHASAAFVMCLYSLNYDRAVMAELTTEHDLNTEIAFGGLANPYRYRMLCMTAGYLVYDFFLILAYRSVMWDTSTLIHHVVIVSAYVSGMNIHFGTFYMSAYVLNEASTPFLNIRWFLYQHKMTEGKLYLAVVVCLVATFAGFRTAVNLAIVYSMVTRIFDFLPVLEERLPEGAIYALPAMAIIHTLVNLYWFIVLIKAVIRVFGRQGTRTRSRKES